MITITSRYRFSASHRLHLPALTEEANEALYGKCNNPYGHGHDYVLEVTCTGTLNAETGLLIDKSKLDGFVEERVLRAFAFRNLNRDVPEFVEKVPTTENIAAVIVRRLQDGWPDALGANIHLARVHVQETDRNGFEILVAAPELRRAQPEWETVSHA